MPDKVKFKEIDFEVDESARYRGKVQWFNVKKGYGYINIDESEYSIYVHNSDIAKNNPKKIKRSLDDDELVEFNIKKVQYMNKSINKLVLGHEAINVTGPNNNNVHGKII